MAEKNRTFMHELVRHHISGQLKVAPEHVSPEVLRRMGKPEVSVYNHFVETYKEVNKYEGMDQYLVPYYMSSHPGCTLDNALELALYIKKSGHRPEQVQDFYPTPGTLSTAMFFTGLDPRDMSEVYVPRDPDEKAMQRALMQYFQPQNQALVIKALLKLGRDDLIGYDKRCLVPPSGGRGEVVRHGTSAGNSPRRGEDKGRREHASDRGRRENAPRHGSDRGSTPRHGGDSRRDGGRSNDRGRRR
jgi:hypothetical protein